MNKQLLFVLLLSLISMTLAIDMGKLKAKSKVTVAEATEAGVGKVCDKVRVGVEIEFNIFDSDGKALSHDYGYSEQLAVVKKDGKVKFDIKSELHNRIEIVSHAFLYAKLDAFTVLMGDLRTLQGDSFAKLVELGYTVEFVDPEFEALTLKIAKMTRNSAHFSYGAPRMYFKSLVTGAYKNGDRKSNYIIDSNPDADITNKLKGRFYPILYMVEEMEVCSKELAKNCIHMLPRIDLEKSMDAMIPESKGKTPKGEPKWETEDYDSFGKYCGESYLTTTTKYTLAVCDVLSRIKALGVSFFNAEANSKIDGGVCDGGVGFVVVESRLESSVLLKDIYDFLRTKTITVTQLQATLTTGLREIWGHTD